MWVGENNMNQSEFNFISSNCVRGDKDLFFGPIQEEDVFYEIEPGWWMSHIMFKAGIFKSISQARQNGWNIEIPKGFTDIRVGKLKKRVTILNF